jgi:hypothetical protein
MGFLIIATISGIRYKTVLGTVRQGDAGSSGWKYQGIGRHGVGIAWYIIVRVVWRVLIIRFIRAEVVFIAVTSIVGGRAWTWPIGWAWTWLIGWAWTWPIGWAWTWNISRSGRWAVSIVVGLSGRTSLTTTEHLKSCTVDHTLTSDVKRGRLAVLALFDTTAEIKTGTGQETGRSRSRQRSKASSGPWSKWGSGSNGLPCWTG